jgi:hypothetical protein
MNVANVTVIAISHGLTTGFTATDSIVATALLDMVLLAMFESDCKRDQSVAK